MYIGKTESGFKVEVKMSERLNSNNLITCFGDSGNGKTTLLKNLAVSAKSEGVPVIIPDTSESYPLSEIQALGDKEYFDIAYEGIPIDMFKPRTVYYDGKEVVEDNVKIANRITGNLLQAFKMEGGTQIATLTTAVKKHLCSSYPKKSFDGVLYELRKMKGTQTRVLENKVQMLADIPVCKRMINWEDIVKNNRTVIFQLSYLDNPLRSLFLELILSDFWNWIRKTKNKKDVFLILDEVSNFSFRSPYFMSNIREFRKFGIGAVFATQFLGGLLGKDAVNLLNQAAMHMYFGIGDSKESVRAAKNISHDNYKEWVTLIKQLDRGECIFCGKIQHMGEVLDQKVLIRVPFHKQ